MLLETMRRDVAQIIEGTIWAVQPDEAFRRALKGKLFPGRVVWLAL